MAVNTRGAIGVKIIIWLPITCIFLVLLLGILIRYDFLPMIKDEPIAESAVDNEAGPVRSTLMPVLLKQLSFKCRLPFHPVEN